MYRTLVIIFVATYVLVKFVAYVLVMPFLPKKSNKLTGEAVKHYKSVVDSRRWKGILSIVIGIIVGVIIYYVSTHEYNQYNRWGNIIFVTFWAMFVSYEIMWQNKFIFESNDLNEMIEDDGKLGPEDTQNLKVYAEMYKQSRYADNLINVVTVGICGISVTAFYFKLKHKYS